MSFYQKVNKLCRNRGISITALAIALGFSKGTPTNWKTMTKPPRAENVKKIADYFGVPVSYLTETEEDAPSPIPSPETQKNSLTEQALNEGEKSLLDLFREVPEDQQRLVLDMIRVALNKKE